MPNALFDPQSSGLCFWKGGEVSYHLDPTSSTNELSIELLKELSKKPKQQ